MNVVERRMRTTKRPSKTKTIVVMAATSVVAAAAVDNSKAMIVVLVAVAVVEEEDCHIRKHLIDCQVAEIIIMRIEEVPEECVMIEETIHDHQDAAAAGEVDVVKCGVEVQEVIWGVEEDQALVREEGVEQVLIHAVLPAETLPCLGTDAIATK